MATVEVRLCAALPRWVLSTDPHVRINGGIRHRLTKAPIVESVPAGPLVVEFTCFDERQRRPRVFRCDVEEGDAVRLRYRPALIASYLRNGQVRRE